MARLKLALLAAACAPWDLALLVLLSLAWPLTRARLRREHGVLFFDASDGSFAQRRWRYSTTFGHCVLLQPSLRGSVVETHELVHVRQFEAAVCGAWLAAALAASGFAIGAAPVAALFVAALAPWLAYFGASLSAWLRSERPYFDNQFEQAARAQSALSRPS
jgi:hypothetical protein